MGLRNGNTNITYLRIRDGKFYVGKDKEAPQGELEGNIIGLRYKDEEYEGLPIRKLIVTVKDEGSQEVFQFGLNCDSRNYTSLVGFLPNADLSKPLVLHPKSEVKNKDGKDIKEQSILVSQDGTYCKGYFTKENTHGTPEWKKVKVGKKVVIDKSDYLAFYENFVNETLVPRIKGVVSTSVVQNEEKVEATEVETTDKLPWDN